MILFGSVARGEETANSDVDFLVNFTRPVGLFTLLGLKAYLEELEELDKMFTLTDFKKTKFYQDTFSEGKIEGKFEAIPNLVRLGFTPQQIAEVLNLSLDLVNQFIRNNSEKN